MIFERTFDAEVVKSVITSPEIWDVVSDDSMNIETYEPDPVGVVFITVTSNNGEIMGLFTLAVVNSVTLRGHIAILPEFRKISGEIALEAARWFIENCGEYTKIIAEIPSIFPNVMAFISRSGFNKEGVRVKSIMKGGVLHDVHLFGITKDELIKRVL